MDTQRDMEETQDSPGAAGAEEPMCSAWTSTARERVSEARRELINRIGEASLKAVLDGLQQEISGSPAVIGMWERNEVLQQHHVTQDQVRCLVDMLRNKGNSACQRFLSHLGEVDPALCEDLYDPNLSFSCHFAGPGSTVNSASTTPKQKADQQPVVLKLKEWIVSQYKTVQEYNDLPGQDVLLTDRYTQLLIIEKHRKLEEREKEMRTSGAGFFGARQKEYKSITVDQLFKPNDRGDVSKAVILQGNSGHGKSFTAQKIILDWASGSLYQDRFELVLHLSCKEFNLLYKEGEQSSVLDLVNVDEKYIPLVQKKLKESPQKVLLLIDGFDELQFNIKELRKSPVKDLSTPSPVDAIVGALLKGSILSECHLLVTTRPTASDKLNKLLKRPVRCTEILGFSEEGVHDYFKMFCKDEKFKEEALGSVKENETLYTSCFIPVICWIVCTVFREHMQKHIEVANALETTTSIFVHFVKILLEHHCRGLKQPVPLLRSLGQLAERGIQKQQVLFDKASVEGTVSDLTSVPFLCKFLLKETVEKKEMFSFMHLSFQEFFAALHYTSYEDQENVKKMLELVEQQEDRTHLLPVIQFLFGLSKVKVMQDLKDIGLTSNLSLEAKEWIVKRIENNSEKDAKMLFTLHCLYELHEDKFVRTAMAVWDKVKFDSIPLTRADCWVLLYCLQCCPTIPSLTLSECNITPDKLRMLQPALRKCQKLGLAVDNLSDADVRDLVSAMGEGKTLSDLSVLNSSLSDESVQQILTAVSKQKSVGNVLLTVKTITLVTAECLLNFMKSTPAEEFVIVGLPGGSNGDGSLCSCLIVKRLEEHLMLGVANYGDTTSPESEPSGLALGVILPETTYTLLLEEFTCRFQQLRHLVENSPEYDKHVDGLMAYPSSVPDLKWVGLEAACLTEAWAIRIISLINTPHLERVEFNADITDERMEEETGLLLEEGIHLLQEAQIPPGRSIKLTGLRCRKSKDRCRRWRDRKLSCNRYVEIEIPAVKKKEVLKKWKKKWKKKCCVLL
ncbi:NACHT, LRR and PYD domains-containing protein 1 homolog [Engraulis encrasicolus]|uniref:NACHT, LRR and PYD domains-containing protein 1 homolog n=1 Tax=Engraulis encrasicolus TaxID=184585 RepID=UPI002FD5F9F7